MNKETVLENEWKELMAKALNMGITSKEIRHFLTATAAQNRKERVQNGR